VNIFLMEDPFKLVPLKTQICPVALACGAVTDSRFAVLL
jgi:hypothetical protein